MIKDTPSQKAKKIIGEIVYITLATVSKDGVPWNTPLWSAHDKDYNFYFGSPKNTQHAKNIRANGKGFVVIYDSRIPEGEGEGVYITATVKELTRVGEVKEAIKVMYKSKAKDVSTDKFLGKSILRAYKVIPKKVWINDAERRDELYIDFRISVKLK